MRALLADRIEDGDAQSNRGNRVGSAVARVWRKTAIDREPLERQGSRVGNESQHAIAALVLDLFRVQGLEEAMTLC